jgi:methionyl-tRNA formyltransferase
MSDKRLSVFISGQKIFAERVLALCLRKGHAVVGVCCPLDDKYIGRLAAINGIPIIASGMLNGDSFPDGVDLGIAAHSFDYVGKRTRYKARYGWIGFHPSLLPRHRGRSAIEWAVRMRDPVIGGTIYWLNSGIDRGDIGYQEWAFTDPAYFAIPPAKAASYLWRETLQDIGLRLFDAALTDISNGVIIKSPQEERFSTWEPSTDVKDIYRPDALMLPAPRDDQR